MTPEKILTALADPNRRAIFERLASAPCPVNEVAGPLTITRAAVSQHLRVLREAGLVTETKSGRQRIYRACPDALDALTRYARKLTHPATPDETRDEYDLMVENSMDWFHLDPNVILIAFRIRQVARLIDDDVRQIGASVGLQGGEMILLDALRRRGPPFEASPSELKNEAWITLAGITKQIDRLEQAGHVVRRAHPSDGRGILVRLTRSGRAVLDKANRFGQQNPIVQALLGMPAPTREELAKTLRKLRNEIEKLQK